MSKRYKIAILGSTGMLGHAVGQYFDNHPDYETHLSYRDEKLAYGKYNFKFDAIDYIGMHRDPVFPLKGYDYIINCIGGIRQHPFTDTQLSQLNVSFPMSLLAECMVHGTKLIHVSTDCVFSGKKGNYHEQDMPDPTDTYGMTKLIGEPLSDGLVLRTSLIGEELHTNVSLLGWAKSQAGKEVNGFTNHLWNGVTTKQLAKCCDVIIQKGLWTKGLRHVFNPTPVSKAEMLEAFSKRFDLGLKVKPIEAPERIDRTLSTLYPLCSELEIPSFDALVASM